jgi:hypothetical protein
MALTLAEKTLFFGACFYCLKAPKTENLTCLQHVLKFKDSSTGKRHGLEGKRDQNWGFFRLFV